MRSHQTTTLASFFLPITTNFDFSTSVKMNQHSTHLGHRSSTSTVIVWTHMHPTYCSSWGDNTPKNRQCLPPNHHNTISQQHISLIVIVFCSGFAFTVQFTEKQGYKAIIDYRLRPRCCHLWVTLSTRHFVVAIYAVYHSSWSNTSGRLVA